MCGGYGVKGSESGDRVNALCVGVVIGEGGVASSHVSEKVIVRVGDGDCRCTGVWDGEKDGAVGENTIGVVVGGGLGVVGGDCGVVVDVFIVVVVGGHGVVVVGEDGGSWRCLTNLFLRRRRS